MVARIVGASPPRHHAPVQPFFLALAGRFIFAVIALGFALLALVIVAALADGRAPDPARLARVGFGATPALAAIWVMLDLRRAQAEVAFAALGVRPGHLGTALALLAAPVLAMDAPVEPPGVSYADHTLRAPGLQIDWRDGAAWRADDEHPLVGLPEPGPMPRAVEALGARWGLRVGVLWLGLLNLLRLDRARALPAGFVLAGAVFWIGA